MGCTSSALPRQHTCSKKPGQLDKRRECQGCFAFEESWSAFFDVCREVDPTQGFEFSPLFAGKKVAVVQTKRPILMRLTSANCWVPQDIVFTPSQLVAGHPLLLRERYLRQFWHSRSTLLLVPAGVRFIRGIPMAICEDGSRYTDQQYYLPDSVFRMLALPSRYALASELTFAQVLAQEIISADFCAHVQAEYWNQFVLQAKRTI